MDEAMLSNSNLHLRNAFGADTSLTQLTIVFSVEENAEFCLCTVETNVALRNFSFEIRIQAQTLEFGA